MKSQELLSQIKNLLGMEDIALEKLNLENGTVLEAESFEAGKEVFILSEDEKIPLPIGEYQLEDGRGLEETDRDWETVPFSKFNFSNAISSIPNRFLI